MWANCSSPRPMTTAESTSAAGEGASDIQRTEVATAAAPSTPTRTTNRRAGVRWVRASTPAAARGAGGAAASANGPGLTGDGERKSVGSGTSRSVRVDIGGRLTIKNTIHTNATTHTQQNT